MASDVSWNSAADSVTDSSTESSLTQDLSPASFVTRSTEVKVSTHDRTDSYPEQTSWNVHIYADAAQPSYIANELSRS